MVGFGCGSALAQSSANSKWAKNYPVCLVGNQYQICNSGEKQDIGRTTEVSQDGYLSIETTTVHLGRSTTSGNTINRGRIRVTYDKMNDPYWGRPAMSNDGVNTNKYRNLNYLNSSHPIPANDGGISNR